jgi:hypothetical protein
MNEVNGCTYPVLLDVLLNLFQCFLGFGRVAGVTRYNGRDGNDKGEQWMTMEK